MTDGSNAFIRQGVARDTGEGTHGPQRNRRGIRTGVAIAAVALLIGVGVGWAVKTVFAPPQRAEADAFSLVAVTSGEVGSSLSLNTVATWSTSPVALNGASGIVTSVDTEPGSEVTLGQRLYTVNLRPAVAGQGSIPSYGAIAPGDQGPQVAQLQQLLADLGRWDGGQDGRFTNGFADVVRAWQRDTGFPADGVVQMGDIVWVPKLPARMSLDSETIVKGEPVLAGEGDIVALDQAPTFRIPVSQSQTRFAPTGTRVLVQAPDGSQWEAVAGSQIPDEASSETILIELTAPDGGPVCADACDQIDANGQVTLMSEIVTVPVQAGLVVPASAVTTDASGQASVIDAAGNHYEVTVVQSARGMALIEGIDTGLDVRVPARQGG